MRQLIGTIFLLPALSFTACQQAQEADEEADTVVIEKETRVQQPEEPDVDMDVSVEGERDAGATGQAAGPDRGAAGEVEVREGQARGEARVEERGPATESDVDTPAAGEIKVQEFRPPEEGQPQQP